MRPCRLRGARHRGLNASTRLFGEIMTDIAADLKLSMCWSGAYPPSAGCRAALVCVDAGQRQKVPPDVHKRVSVPAPNPAPLAKRTR